jgi:hypothetical protein
MTSILVPQVVHGTRAVQRPVPQGSTALCAGCETLVKFSAKNRRNQVIANVYADGRWNRVEHYHPECYLTSGEPHGAVRDG